MTCTTGIMLEIKQYNAHVHTYIHMYVLLLILVPLAKHVSVTEIVWNVKIYIITVHCSC